MTGQDGCDPAVLFLWLTMVADDGSRRPRAAGPIKRALSLPLRRPNLGTRKLWGSVR